MKNLFMQILGMSLILLTTLSCDDDPVIIKQSGNLSIEIKSANNGTIDSATLYLFDISVLESGISFENKNIENYAVNVVKQTKSNNFSFGEVNSGNYLVFGEVIDSDSSLYNVNQFVQIVSGSSITKEIDLADYVGSVLFNIRYYNYNFYNIEHYLSNLNILLVPSDITNVQYMDLPTLKGIGIELGKTDNSGSISADNIPAISYYVVGYFENGTYDILSPSTNSIYPITVQKNSVLTNNLYSDIDYTVSEDIPGDDDGGTNGIYVYSIHYDRETGSSDTVKIIGANILICEDNESRLSWAIDDAELQLTTDDQGIAEIPDNTNFYYSNYYIWVYLDSETYTEIGPFTKTEISNGMTNISVSYNSFYREFGSVEMNIFTEFSDQSLDNATSPFVFGTVLLTNSTSTSLPSGYTATSDNTGLVSFENLPVGNYFLWAYTDSEHSQKSSTVVTVNANETTQLTEVFISEKILQLKDGLSFSIEGNNGGATEAIENINVIVTTSYTSNISTAIANAIATKKTDSKGLVNFDNLEVGKQYYVYTYYDLDLYFYNNNTSYTVVYNSNTVHTLNTGTTFLE